MNKQTFADGVGAVGVRESVVRIDLVSYPPAGQTDDQGQPIPVFARRLFMSVPDLAATYENLRKVMDEMVRKGFLVKNQEADE